MLKDIYIKKGCLTEFCPEPLVADDVNAYRLIFETEDDLGGCTFLIKAQRADGTVVSDIGRVDAGRAEYIIARNMYAIEGELKIRASLADENGGCLTEKELVFCVLAEFGEADLTGDDRYPVLSTLLAQVRSVQNEGEAVNRRSDALTETSVNLLNPDRIGESSFVVEGLTAGQAYCCNIHKDNVYTVMSHDGEDVHTIPYSVADNGIYISPEDMLYDNLIVVYSPTADTSQLMFAEGSVIPSHFKPYGVTEYISDGLLQSAYAEIDRIKTKTDTLTGTSVKLKNNTVYSIDIADNTEFALPVVAESGSQILVQANITADVSINWGTACFFGGVIPTITQGRYDFIFECDGGNWYDGGRWYVGTVYKGQVTA